MGGSFPTFLGIGAQRSGTTWVAEVLRTHPDIWIGKKELHFFDQNSRAGVHLRRLKPWDRYVYQSKFWSHRHFRAFGEFTPAYAALPDEGIAVIARWMPDVQLIYVMRNPVDRAWSQTRKRLFKRHDGDLGRATDAEIARLALDSRVDARSDYAGSINRWMEHFPKEQFFFGLTSDLESDPISFCRALFTFLGVDPDHDPGPILMERRNSRPPLDMPENIRQRLIEKYMDQEESVRALTGLEPRWNR